MIKKNHFYILLFGLMIISIYSGCKTGNHKFIPENLTIMSYNVRNCNGMDGVTDFQRVADIILNVGADCCCTSGT
jgi:hypothetical protein